MGGGKNGAAGPRPGGEGRATGRRRWAAGTTVATAAAACYGPAALSTAFATASSTAGGVASRAGRRGGHAGAVGASPGRQHRVGLRGGGRARRDGWRHPPLAVTPTPLSLPRLQRRRRRRRRHKKKLLPPQRQLDGGGEGGEGSWLRGWRRGRGRRRRRWRRRGPIPTDPRGGQADATLAAWRVEAPASGTSLETRGVRNNVATAELSAEAPETHTTAFAAHSTALRASPSGRRRVGLVPATCRSTAVAAPRRR